MVLRGDCITIVSPIVRENGFEGEENKCFAKQ